MYKFCPRCGYSLLENRSESNGAQRGICLNCGFIYYPVSKPCVGVFVLKENKVLLVRRAVEPFKGQWDIPGGFLEKGEDPVEGAIREVREETGFNIKIAKILGIFMDEYGRDREATLNICYTASVIGGTPGAGSDATAMDWFDLEILRKNLAEIDIAFQWSKAAINRLLSSQK
jgi:ADP-ribose pyrophosphatase YjhB (NUDIX family)